MVAVRIRIALFNQEASMPVLIDFLDLFGNVVVHGPVLAGSHSGRKERVLRLAIGHDSKMVFTRQS